MHAIILAAALATTGTGTNFYYSSDSAPNPEPLPSSSADTGESVLVGGYAKGGKGGHACGVCHGRGCVHCGLGAGCGVGFSQWEICGPMPQTCYGPRYGCYPGANNRYMHRYPAFHGTYYRRPYNYRNVFDYPWHAKLHEPTSLFSHNVPIDPNAPPEDNDDNRNGGGSGQPSLQPEQLPSAANILTRPARVLRRYR